MLCLLQHCGGVRWPVVTTVTAHDYRNLYGLNVNAQQLERAVVYVRSESLRIERMAPEYFLMVILFCMKALLAGGCFSTARCNLQGEFEFGELSSVPRS